jgi:hypothetical protein
MNVHNKQKIKDEEWQIVQRNRYRNRLEGEKGTCTLINGSFKAANPSRISMLINNVHKEISEKDVTLYVKKKNRHRGSLAANQAESTQGVQFF